MAASAVIGALRVNLGLNSASFRSGLDKSSNRLSSFAKLAAASFTIVAGAATAAFAKVRGAAQEADKLIKASRSLGLPVEELSALSYAAELSGVSFDELATGIRRGSQLVGQSLQGMSNEGTKYLDQLGVSIVTSDGQVRSMYDILGDVADRFAKMPDGVQKTAIAVSLFGRSGAKLIPLLNSGSEGIAQMSAEAARLGLVIDTKTGVAAELFNDNLTRLQRSITGLWNRVLMNVIPAFAELTTKFSDAITNGNQFDSVVAGISNGLTVLVRGLGFAFAHLEDLYDLFRIWVAAQTISYIISLGGSFITLAKTIYASGLSMRLVARLTHQKIIMFLLLGAVIAKLAGVYDDFTEKLKELGRRLIDILPPEVQEGLDELKGAFEAVRNAILGTDEAAAQSFETYMRVGDQASHSFDRVIQNTKEAEGALKDAEDRAKSFADRVQQGFSGVGSSLRGLIDQTTSWQDVLLNVLETIARIAVQQWMINTTPEGGHGLFGNVLSGLIGGFLGFASGGAFRVGGNGGTDSQLVAFRASPDEVVSVMTPEQQREAADTGASVGNTVIQHNKMVVQTPDIRSFKASEQQLAGRFAQMTRRGARNL